MRTEDREILMEVRWALNGLAMKIGQLIDQEFFRELEGNIDAMISKITKRMERR